MFWDFEVWTLGRCIMMASLLKRRVRNFNYPRGFFFFLTFHFHSHPHHLRWLFPCSKYVSVWVGWHANLLKIFTSFTRPLILILLVCWFKSRLLRLVHLVRLGRLFLCHRFAFGRVSDNTDRNPAKYSLKKREARKYIRPLRILTNTYFD